MKVSIEFELDGYEDDSESVHDLLVEWTKPIRGSRRLRPETWHIDIDFAK